MRFYFDVTNGQTTIRDTEGIEAADLDEATAQTQAVIEELRRSGELNGFHEGWRLIIREMHGSIHRNLPIT